MAELNLETYQRTLEYAGFYRLPEPGYLKIAGPDRHAFLQRQTTNDVARLAPGKMVITVLTNPSARILDVLLLMEKENPGEDPTLLAVTLPGQGQRTFRYLKSRIFFNDKVSIENISYEMSQIELWGPEAGFVLEELGLSESPGQSETAVMRIGKAAVTIAHLDPALAPGFRLFVSAAEVKQVVSELERVGAVELDAATYDLLRIELGLPSAGSELTEDYTPLETGLNVTVSDTKGCYTGQEVLARQITYDKVTQQLRGLRLQEPASAGMRVWAEGRTVGTITSVADSPRFGWIALALIKRPHHAPGTEVSAGESRDSAAKATVSDLPFKEA